MSIVIKEHTKAKSKPDKEVGISNLIVVSIIATLFCIAFLVVIMITYKVIKSDIEQQVSAATSEQQSNTVTSEQSSDTSDCEPYFITGIVNGKTILLNTMCVDDVEYFYKKVGESVIFAPHIKLDGTLYPCKNN